MATGTIRNTYKKRTLGTPVNILSYTSSEYTTPSDGYIRIDCSPQTSAFITVYFDGVYMGRSIGVTGAQATVTAIPVVAGTKVKVGIDALTGVTHAAYFIPYI